jgi:hypothetical protein
MGIRSYVRDRKQVKASRAGEGSAKLSAGDFSHFGGKNGASIEPFDSRVDIQDMRSSKSFGVQPASGYSSPLGEKTSPDAPKREAGAPSFAPSNPEGFSPKRTDAFTNVSGKKSRRGSIDPKTNREYDKPETPEEETSRGARMKVSENVTVLGDRVGGKPDANGKPTGDRWKIDGDTRGRVRSIKEQNSAQGRSDDLPTTKDVDKENNKNKMKKPTPGKKAWDED